MEILKYRKDGSSEWQSFIAIKGEDGKTPVKGVDYWTAADRQEIIDSLPLTESGDIDLTNYATKDYVDSAIDNLDLSDIDLSGYVTKTELGEQHFASTTFVHQQIAATGHINEGRAKILIDNSLNGYATEDYVDNAIANIDIPSGDSGGMTESQVLSLLISKGYITESAVETLLESKVYATEQYVDGWFNNNNLPNYYTKDEIDAMIPPSGEEVSY